MGLHHRIPRELRANALRYLALLFLIVLGMYVVVGIVGAAETIIHTVAVGAARNAREDGQFTVFAPLSAEQLEGLRRAGAEVEPMFSLDFAMADGSILRVFRVRERINLAQADQGALPGEAGELLLEKLYAGAHGLGVGDALQAGGLSFRISGTGSSPDYDAVLQGVADVASDKRNFGIAFVDDAVYARLKADGGSLQSETILYAYRLGDDLTHAALKGQLKALPVDVAALDDPFLLERLRGATFGHEISNLLSFLKAEDNPRIAASVDDVAINRTGGILAGVIALVLFTYVISVFIVHCIDRDSPVIGTLYAMGVSRGELLRHYFILPVLMAALGGILGTALGFSPLGVGYQMRDTAGYFSYPEATAYYPVFLLGYGLVMPPLVAAGVNWLVVRSRLARPPLQLLRREQGAARGSRVRLEWLGFIDLFRIRQILREKRAALVVAGGMFVALLLLILGVNCYAFITTLQRENAADIRYEYMVSLKYPPAEVPLDATPAYLRSLSREAYGHTLEVNLLGIGAENPYFDFVPTAGTETLTISSSMANKYRLRPGDEVVLTDAVEERRYVFTVDQIVPYSVGLYAFMDLDSMRERFGAGSDEYNVLLADAMPAVEAGRIYAVTQRADLLEFGGVFMDLMTPMIVLMVSVSVVVLVIVLYLMMKMMVDRSALGISLMKIFGFTDGEVRRLYLDGNLLTVAASALLGVPLAKLAMNQVYPYMIANAAMGPEMAMPAWLYATIFGLILVSYFAISALLDRRLKRVTPAEALKQRE